MLELAGDPVALCAALVDVPSVSGEEAGLADLVEAALREQAPHLEVLRTGDTVLARTRLGRERRVLLAGHLDTVPVADNLPSRRDGDLLYGCGTSDMKAGDAVFAHVVATTPEPRHDLTIVFYDCEEVEAARNGLGRVEREHRDWLDADLALLGEPTSGAVEAGCQGTLRAEVRTRGRRAHSARSWLGDNAIHAAGDVLERLRRYPAREVAIDGCVYREGLQAVRIAGGVAGNVVPDDASSPSTSASRPTATSRPPNSTCARSSTGWTSWSPTPRPGRSPACTPRRRRSSSRRRARRRRRSTAGPTSPGSPRWASPR